MLTKDVETMAGAAQGKADICEHYPVKFFIRAIMAGFFIVVATILSNVSAAVLYSTYPQFGKLLGPFFISKNMLDEIKNNKEQVDELEAKDEASRTEKDNEALKDMHQKENSYIKAFESKVIMYLFEDVMKMRPENIFIGHHKKNGKMIFSEICKAFEQDGEGIFGIDDLENI